MKVTDDALKSLFSYCATTGEFVYARNVLGGNGGIAKTKGQRAGYKRSEDGYIALNASGRRLLAHRVAWLLHYGSWPAGEVDHINGDRADNRIANLRDVTRQGNQQNQRLLSATKKSTPLKGVSWHAPGAKWKARITKDKRTFWLGYFASAQEAHEAYVAAKRQMHDHWPAAQRPAAAGA